MSSLVLNPKYPNTAHIYVDGSLRPIGNASCAYLIYHEKSKSILKMAAHSHRDKTINQMELYAINHALDFPRLSHVVIYSDSAYTIMCLSVWRKVWAKNNWIATNGEPVKNKDLIIEISEKIDALKFCAFKKIKSHSGDLYNSVVDYLAQELSKKMRDHPNLPDGEYTFDGYTGGL